MHLMAKYSPVFICLAFRTSEKVPSPIFSRILYSSNLEERFEKYFSFFRFWEILKLKLYKLKVNVNFNLLKIIPRCSF